MIYSSSNTQARPAIELVKVSLTAAFYVAVPLVFAVSSFGSLQVRLSEMCNYLALYHMRYVWGVTSGVGRATFLSPAWGLDVAIGGSAKFLTLLLCRAVSKRM